MPWRAQTEALPVGPTCSVWYKVDVSSRKQWIMQPERICALLALEWSSIHQPRHQAWEAERHRLSFDRARGRGSRGILYYGDRRTVVKDRKKPIGVGLLAKMRRD